MQKPVYRENQKEAEGSLLYNYCLQVEIENKFIFLRSRSQGRLDWIRSLEDSNEDVLGIEFSADNYFFF